MSARQTLLLFCVFFAASSFVLGDALRGAPFTEDDLFLKNPYLQELSLENLVAVLDPTGPPAISTFNYAPVHALLHAVEIQLFGGQMLGYHLVNVALHALASALLAALLVQTGVPRSAALLGAALFLVHPANVEAVAWIFQLKTSAAAALAFGALLAQPRRPGLAILLFTLALLTKALAAFALPVMAALVWARAGARAAAAPGPDAAARAGWRWLAIAAGVFALVAAAEFPIFLDHGAVPRPLFEADRLLHARAIVAIAARYLAMAATGYGVSAFHEPALATPPSDPWWLAGLVLLPLFGWRLVATLRRRKVEAAYWVWALAGFAPISQVFPFTYAMADRYLYFILPGLIGAGLLAAREGAEAIREPRYRRGIYGLAAAAGACLAVYFSVQSFERAGIWRHRDAVLVDAALHYPEGTNGQLLRARAAARAGDVDASVAALRAARARGWTWFGVLFTDPVFARVRRDPRFADLVRELTEPVIRSLRAQAGLGQGEFQMLAQFHLWRDERQQAERALERALALGGGEDANIRASLRRLRGGAARGTAKHPRPAFE